MTIVQIEEISRVFGMAFIEFIVRSSVLVAAGALLLVVFQRRTAELSHFVLRGVLYGLLLLPVLQVAAPPLNHSSDLLAKAENAMLPARTGASVNKYAASNVAQPTAPMPLPRPFPWFAAFAATYLSITLLLMLRLGSDLLRLRRIVRRSEPLINPDLQELWHEVWLQSLTPWKPPVRVSPDAVVPMAVSLDGACILLPSRWQHWPSSKLKAVLIHEMAHVRRQDPATSLLTALTVCFFWIHPLVYWLRKQLAALAEEACDEATLRFMQPEPYARMLLEFAGDVKTAGGRLAAVSAVAARESSIQKRLGRIFSPARPMPKSYGLVRVLLVAAFVPVLYLTAAARFDQSPEASGVTQPSVISITSQQQAGQLESDLTRDPDNTGIRGALMIFYSNTGQRADFTRHLRWMVDHHPEAPIAALRFYGKPDQGDTHSSPGDAAALQTSWEHALSIHPDSAAVLLNAGTYFELADPQSGLNMFADAKRMAPDDPDVQRRSLHSTAVVLAAAVMADIKQGDPHFRLNNISITPSLAIAWRADVESSRDADLLGAVGLVLTKLGDAQVAQVGLSYIRKANDLDRDNPKWKDELESAQAEPQRRANLQALHQNQTSGQAVRIGPDVAKLNLSTKVDPPCPAVALQAHIRGSVEFTVDIAPDGHIQSVQLVRGHPVLVNAAKDAVLQYVYRPTLLNGVPVLVTTSVIVPFNCDR
jgi:beta-lactamase regulating signal transducer with metallopeptidase domain